MLTFTKRPHEDVLSYLSAKARKSLTTARSAGGWHIQALCYMAPARESGVGNVCPSARDCIKDCLWRSGQVLMAHYARRTHRTLVAAVKKVGLDREQLVKILTDKGASKASATSSVDGFITRGGEIPKKTVEQARIEKSRRWFNDREAFVEDVFWSVARLVRSAPRWSEKTPAWLRKAGVPSGAPITPVLRLNGTSDLSWEEIRYQGKTIMETFPGLTMLDYTKNWWRAIGYARGFVHTPAGAKTSRPWPRNYHITFSMGGLWDEKIPMILQEGCNVTMVFDSHKGVPTTMSGPMQIRDHAGKPAVIDLPRTPVIYGDEDDLRFLDPPGHVVGLKYKSVVGNTKDPAFVLQVPGDAEAMFAAILFGKREETVARENPAEEDLLGDGPTGAFVPGAVNPVWIPPSSVEDGSPTSDHTSVERLGCGGFGYGKPMRQR